VKRGGYCSFIVSFHIYVTVTLIPEKRQHTSANAKEEAKRAQERYHEHQIYSLFLPKTITISAPSHPLPLLFTDPPHPQNPHPLRLHLPHLRKITLKPPRTNPPLKQLIHLPKRPPLRLRQPPPTPNYPHNRRTSPEEARFSAPAPRRGIQHARGDDVSYDTANIVAVAGKNDGFGAETGRRNLANKRIADGSQRSIVC
jgi:hypothetical protein